MPAPVIIAVVLSPVPYLLWVIFAFNRRPILHPSLRDTAEVEQVEQVEP